MKSLFQIITQACDELGMPRPASIISSQDLTVRQMLGFANREGSELSQMPTQGWPVLRKEYTFNVQSTGLILGCSYTSGSNIITIGTPPTQAPQVGWVLSISGASNATGFTYPCYVTAVNGPNITVSSNATTTTSNSTLAFGKESYSLPSDFNYLINDTIWDRGYRWQIIGSMNAQEWQVLKSGLSPTGPRRRFRLMDNLLYLDPIPYDSNTIAYEYYSNAWCATSGGAPQTAWANDTDVPVLSDDLFVLGIIWRFRRAKGLDYAQEYKMYMDKVQSMIGRASGARALPMGAGAGHVNLIGNSQIPDTGFGK